MDQSSKSLEIEYFGHSYLAIPNQYVDWQVLVTGAYEIEDLDVIKRIYKSFREINTALDIGTNVGHHAFYFAALGWRVEAFEPNPSLWPIIEAKLAKASNLEVRLHKVGLGERDEIVRFHIPEALNSGTGTFASMHSGSNRGQELPIYAGDAYLELNQVRKIDLIKIDVQGLEAQVLKGLTATIARCRPFICLEIGPENRDTLPNLNSLRTLIPSNYVFIRVSVINFFIFRFFSLTIVSDDDFKSLDGNLFCVPEEKINILFNI